MIQNNKYCRHQNKFALALYDSKEWIKFSVTAFEQTCLRNHSIPKSDCFTSLWSQPGFGNQSFPVLVSLFSSHAYESTVSPGLVGSWLTWISQITRGSDSLWLLNFENCEKFCQKNFVLWQKSSIEDTLLRKHRNR